MVCEVVYPVVKLFLGQKRHSGHRERGGNKGIIVYSYIIVA
jgi:hypothetical protein